MLVVDKDLRWSNLFLISIWSLMNIEGSKRETKTKKKERYSYII